MGRWDDSGSWQGEKLRREAFFFRSDGVDLYGSVYAADSPSPPLGVLTCNSWGIEANNASRTIHDLSIAVARSGGVAASFHYPGFGDSQGDLAASTLERMADSVGDALREASRRYPETRWILAGLMLGASVAALAAGREPAAERLLLIQPSLRPGDYFARLERAARRSLGTLPRVPGVAFGYPLPAPLLASAAQAEAPIAAALADFAGEGTVVSHEAPAGAAAPAPERFEQVRVPGPWRFGVRHDPPLAGATTEWLRRQLKAAVR